ncbi:arrestin domain-containing protein 3-like protein [Aphelenchoides avenae]|nr:arrestin domain-containing protein 3-like protein [Aphelenchus avenae]
MVHVTVQLKDIDAIYQPGDTIEGFVVLKTKSPIRVQAIELKTVGRAVTKWTEAHGRNTRLYNGRFYYIDFTMPLVELGETASEDDGGRRSTTEIAAGEYVYPFSFSLPMKIMPPTFKEAPH